jgi:SH3-like domain-containing protein
MDTFRADVRLALTGSLYTNVTPYRVRICIPDLNIRKGPGTNYAILGKYTGKGVFTIVEEAFGAGATKWGKLKSGIGWISLDYGEKLQ